MEDSYSYPLDISWSQVEMLAVMDMWQALEDLYEKGMSASLFLEKHGDFKKVVKSIGEERRLGKEFEEVSGYSLYRAVEAAKKAPGTVIKMKGA